MFNPIRYIRNRIRTSDEHRTYKIANERYQVCEFDGNLWITVNGMRSVSSDMLSIDIIEALNTIRNIYIQQHL